MISLRHIDKVFPLWEWEVQVLFDVSLSIESGEFVAIVWPSGSGKSTLMNIIWLLDSPTRGEYFFDREKVGGIPDRKQSLLRGERIGFIFQNYGLIPRMKVIDQVMLPLWYQSVARSERYKRALEALDRVGLADQAQKKPDALSWWQRQRVAIARALVVKPRLILADEPTGALDSHTGEEVMSLFRQLHHEGSTIVIVTHSPEIAQSCTRCITIRDGKIQSDVKNIKHSK